MAIQDLTKLEEKIDPSRAVAIQARAGRGIILTTMSEVAEFAKYMALARGAVPAFLVGNLGGCFAVCNDAMQLGMPPFAVAKLAYQTKPEQPIAYMAQLWHAAAQKLAPIKGRFKITYRDEGANRVCIVAATFKGEEIPSIVESPPIGKITPKNSPLWTSNPDQQLAYYTMRLWVRRLCPEVMLGLLADDDVWDSPALSRAPHLSLITDPFADEAPTKSEPAQEQHDGPAIEGETQPEPQVNDYGKLTDEQVLLAIDVTFSPIKSLEEFEREEALLLPRLEIMETDNRNTARVMLDELRGAFNEDRSEIRSL
jgi:hypothetical protein